MPDDATLADIAAQIYACRKTREALREDPLRCSFCSKSQDNVRKLIAGPDVYICDECVDVCEEILADEVDEVFVTAQTSPQDAVFPCNLCGIPSPVQQNTIIRDRGVVVCKPCLDAILATLGLDKRDA